MDSFKKNSSYKSINTSISKQVQPKKLDLNLPDKPHHHT